MRSAGTVRAETRCVLAQFEIGCAVVAAVMVLRAMAQVGCYPVFSAGWKPPKDSR